MTPSSKVVPYVDLVFRKKSRTSPNSRKLRRLDHVDIVLPQARKRPAENSESANASTSLRLDYVDIVLPRAKKQRVNPPEILYYDSTGDDSEWAQLDEEILMDNDERIPVRIIDEFTVFNSKTGRMISMQEIESMSPSGLKHHNLVMAGDVMPYVEDDSDSDSDSDDLSTVRMQTTCILEYNSMYLNESHRFDPKLYLRTEFAWYILNTPSALYAPFFCPLFTQHTALHSVLSAAADDEFIAFESFIKSLPFIPILGRCLNKQDFDDRDMKLYLSQNIPSLCHEHNLEHLKNVPLIETLLKGSDGWDSCSDADTDSFHSSTSSATTPTSASTLGVNKRKKLKASAQLTNQFIPNATPKVKEIVRDFFTQDIALCGQPDSDEEDNDVQMHVEHLFDPDNIEWGKWDDQLVSFESVILDGTEYELGNLVIVEPGFDPDKKRRLNCQKPASKHKNNDADRFWFCQIWYFFEECGQKMFHAQWYEHASKTLLQETAHSTGLFCIEECADLPVECIVRRCELKILHPLDSEPQDEKSPSSTHFHCGLVWNPEDCSLTDIPTQQEMASLLASTGSRCYACARKVHKQTLETAKVLDAELHLHGLVYHTHDFVYLRTSSEDKLLKIAEIMSISKQDDHPKVMCRYFERDSQHCSQSEPLRCQERRLILDDTVTEMAVSSIDGKCFVLHTESIDDLSAWIAEPDHWFVQDAFQNGRLKSIPPKAVKSCSPCLGENRETCLRHHQFRERRGPLRGMELFAGAGGLSTGLELSGHVQTCWALEWDQKASEAFRINHPKCRVFSQDVNVLLEQAKELNSDTKKHRPAKDNTLPKDNEVDFIFGGPPCQAYSAANHCKKADDIRATLPMTMLSFVEIYRPPYFLLENVPGLLSFPLLSQQVPDYKYKLEGGIKTGMVKIILRVLVALGYQVRFNTLQAGQYGSPQGRRRVIFWGARRGCPMPDFPIPTHAFPSGNSATLVPALDQHVPAPTRARDDVNHQFAPLAPITVNASICDLPPFEWINPHRIIPRNSKHARASSPGIPQFSAVTAGSDALPGYPVGVQYSSPPQNEYQKWVRQGASDLVTGHYTARYGAEIVEATTTVPLKPNACHRDIPDELLFPCARKGGRQRDKVFYGRLDGDGAFKTALTSAMPYRKGSYTLHPSQRRTISIREAARSQGFPDHYVFVGSPHDQYKQIGNAVPVPLALALGRALGEARFLSNPETRERSPELH